jgi:hypothetical protein
MEIRRRAGVSIPLPLPLSLLSVEPFLASSHTTRMDQYEGCILSGHLEQLRTDLGGFAYSTTLLHLSPYMKNINYYS